MIEKKLVVHIGLPKTGTTTLQKFFFPRYSGYEGKHYPPTTPGSLRVDSFRSAKTKSELPAKLVELYATFASKIPPPAGVRALSTWVEEAARNEQWPLIISQEALSSWPRGHLKWPPLGTIGPKTAESPAVQFVSELRQQLPSEIALKIILTLRNQSDFLASLAAHKNIEGYFNSTGFHQLLARRDPFLDYCKLVQGLEDGAGAQNLLTLIFEDGIEANISKLIDFIGVPDMDTDFGHETKIPTENQKRFGENSWLFYQPRSPILRMLQRMAFVKKLRRSNWYYAVRPFSRSLRYLLTRFEDATPEPVFTTISDDDRLKISAVYGPSNKLLSEHLGRSLPNYGC